MRERAGRWESCRWALAETGCAVLLWLAAGAVGAAQLAVRTYGTAEGLPGEFVTALLEDSRGFLWVGTQTGLARFDGTSFVAYSTSDGLPHPGITALAEDHDGVVWVGTTGGLARMLPGRETDGRLFEAYSFEEFVTGPGSDARFTNEVSGVMIDHAGTLWVSSGPGLYRLQRRDGGSRFTPVELGLTSLGHGRQEVGALAEGPDGSVWTSTSSGLFRTGPGRQNERFPISGDGLLVDRQGDLWIVGDGLQRLTPAAPGAAPVPLRTVVITGPSAQPPPSSPGLLVTWGKAAGMTTRGWALAESRAGELWATTSEGLFVLRAGRLHRYGIAEGLADERLTVALEDSEGNLWVGTALRGVMRIAPTGFVSFTKSDGLLTDRVSQILPDGRGGVLLVGFPPATGVHRVEGDRLVGTRFAIPAWVVDLGWAESQAVLVDHLGDWWVPTGEAVFRYPAVERLESLARASPRAVYGRAELGAQAAFRLFEDSHGDVWMGLLEPGGLARWERRTGAFHRFTAADGVPEGPASAFAEDHDGALWVGFYGGGVARFRDGRFRLFTAEDGIPPGFVSALTVDRRGRLWLGLLRAGVVRIDEPEADRPRTVHYGRREGLGSEAGRCLAEDGQGQIWVGTRNGAGLLDPASGSVRHYDTSSGLVANSVVSIRVDAAGRAWIGTASGVSRFERRPPGPPSRLALRLMEFRAGGKALPVPELGATELSGVRLPVGVRDVELGFAGITLAAGGMVGYQHRFGGREWSAPATERRLHLAGLAPGRYLVELRAVRSDGAASEVARVGFLLPPPLWRRWWVVTGEALLVLAGVLSAWRARRRRRVELERVRSRIAADLHDELGLSLSRIAILSEVARRKSDSGRDAGGAELREIGDAARDLIDATSDMAWALDPQSDDLPSLLARLRRMVADVFDGSGVAWSFAGPEAAATSALGAEQRRHLFLVLKEAVQNAARHARPGHVAVRVAVIGGRIVAEVEDDGVGFDPTSEDAVSGHGMTSMRRRAQDLGGSLEVATRPNGGTLIRLTAPLGSTA